MLQVQMITFNQKRCFAFRTVKRIEITKAKVIRIALDVTPAALTKARDISWVIKIVDKDWKFFPQRPKQPLPFLVEEKFNLVQKFHLIACKIKTVSRTARRFRRRGGCR